MLDPFRPGRKALKDGVALKQLLDGHPRDFNWSRLKSRRGAKTGPATTFSLARYELASVQPNWELNHGIDTFGRDNNNALATR